MGLRQFFGVGHVVAVGKKKAKNRGNQQGLNNVTDTMRNAGIPSLQNHCVCCAFSHGMHVSPAAAL